MSLDFIAIYQQYHSRFFQIWKLCNSHVYQWKYQTIKYMDHIFRPVDLCLVAHKVDLGKIKQPLPSI